MKGKSALIGLFGFIFGCASAFAQGPCSAQTSKLACVIPQEYGSSAFNFTTVLYNPSSGTKDFHDFHFASDFSALLKPVTSEIGRQANLLPLASPSSGVVLSYDPSLKTLVASTDSLGPVLGERGETVGRHRLFLGFSYQFFDFDKIDGINLRNIPAILTHRIDTQDNTPMNSPPVTCDPSIGASSQENLMGCAFVRDLIKTANSIDLKVSQYTSYITFGLTNRIDISIVIPIENVRMALRSQDTIVLGSNGLFTPNPNSPDASILNQNNPPGNGPPYFFHLFKDCPNTSPSSGAAALGSNCLNHTFPDPTWIGTPSSPNGSSPKNAASGIGDVVARVKWNAWSAERMRVAVGLDVRFPSGDALNYLGSGAYGVKPFAVFSYRARVSPHVLVGYEWNSHSILAGDLTTGSKGYVPSDFVYSAGADAWVTKWLTASFDIIGQRFFRGGTESVTSQQFLAPCTVTCDTAPTPNTVAYDSLSANSNASYSITNASMGIKVRPFGKVSRLVLTANVLVRLDDGGLHSKAAPLAGIGYTF
jgi:hypothetical protein